MRLLGPREVGLTPILARKNRTDWDTSIDVLGFNISSHTMRISVPREKIEAIKRLLFEQ